LILELELLAPTTISALVATNEVPTLNEPPPLIVKLVVGLDPLFRPMVTRPFTFSDLSEPIIILFDADRLFVASV